MDYRDFQGDKTPGRDQSTDWWNKSGKDIAHSVNTALGLLERAHQQRMLQLVQNARLYGSMPTLGVPGFVWTRPVTSPGLATKEKLTFNVVQSATDTITSKIAKNRPKPLFLTSGGNYKQQRKAKRLNQFVEGLFYESRAHDLGVMAFRNACIDGDGLIHVFERHGRVCMEVVPSAEIYIDEMEALYGSPRQLHRVMDVDRGVLEALVGHKAQIAEANPAPQPPSGTPNIADAVQVRESWHLPSGPDAKDGKHVITLAGDVLLEEKWKHPWFPFARMQWCPRQYGYWGQGLTEQLMGIQIEINKVLWCIQEGYRLASLAVIFLENGSKVVKSHLTNQIGTVVSYSGTPPEYRTPGVLPPEIYAHLAQLKQSAYEQAGISQLSANSQKPAGLNSGKALREYNDIESDRFQTIGHAYENLFLDAARMGIAIARDIAESEGSYKVKVPLRSSAREIDWREIDLEEDSYIMQCFPVSSLPNDPAGRFETVQEWVQAGWYTPRQGKKLMNFPDLEAVDSLEQAAEDWLTHLLDGIVDDGKPAVPEPFDDLDLAYELALEYYQQGKLTELEPERLQMLRDFMSSVQTLQEQAANQATAQAMAAQPAANDGGQPGAVPMPPPQSALLPNAPGAAA